MWNPTFWDLLSGVRSPDLGGGGVVCEIAHFQSVRRCPDFRVSTFRGFTDCMCLDGHEIVSLLSGTRTTENNLVTEAKLYIHSLGPETASLIQRFPESRQKGSTILALLGVT